MDREKVCTFPGSYRVSSFVKEPVSLMEKKHANICYKPGSDIYSLKQSTLLFSIALRDIIIPVSQMAELRFVWLGLLTKLLTRSVSI